MTEEGSHAAMGVEIQHDVLPDRIGNTAAVSILYWYIEMVAGISGHSDVVLFIRISQKAIERQFPEPLRDTSVRQGNLRLHGRQSSHFALSDRDTGGDKGALGLNEKTI